MRKQSDQLTIPGCGEVVRVSLNSREIATILAALEQFRHSRGGQPSPDYQPEGEISLLTSAEINRLCERLRN